MSITSVKSGATGISLALDNNFMEPIATTLVESTSVNSITFNDIPQGYKHLQIRWTARNNAAFNSFDPSLIRFNSDASNNYTAHYLTGNGSSANAGASTSINYGWIGLTNYGNTTASVFSVGVTDILDYSNTNKFKTIRALSGADCNGSGEAFFSSSLWQSTNAISSITLYSNGNGNFVQHSRFSLYGIKG